MKKNHIVLTTINNSEILREYQKNISVNGELRSTKVWVVGDKKTPSSIGVLCSELTSDGLETEYLDIASQDKWGKRFPEFYRRIPYNNETRRNIGYLHALESGCERLISIDDDNWPISDNFIGCHSVTGKRWTKPLISNSTGYYNICEHLKFEPSRPIFPRGYPFSLRNTTNTPEMVSSKPNIFIGVTSGLWLSEPDVDATIWLNGKISSISFSGPDIFVLNQKTWSPINTQNTSVVRELIPAFFCIPMGWDVPGGKIQRYGDIWGGYFLQALISRTNYVIAFGKPIVDHRRNHHDYIDDMRYEFWGIILTDWIVKILKEFQPKERQIISRLKELSEFLAGTALNKLPAWCTHEIRSFIIHTAKNIMLWAEVCEKITPTNTYKY